MVYYFLTPFTNKQFPYVSLRRHTQQPTNQPDPPLGHLPCSLPFSEEPETGSTKCVSFSKKSIKPAESHEARHFGHRQILRPHYEEVPPQERRFEGGSLWALHTCANVLHGLSQTLLPLVRCIITPIVGLIEGIAPSRKSCLFTHLASTEKM